MRRLCLFLFLLGSLGLATETRGKEPVPTGAIVKVLPLLLNRTGHDALSPSLFDRDAYQFYLRAHTNEISGIRYDVLWKARTPAGQPVKIKVELKAVGPDGGPRAKTLEITVNPGRFRHWTEIPLTGEDFVKLGPVVAWRTSIWAGDQLLGSQQSFLW